MHLDWLLPIEPERLPAMSEESYAAEPGVRASILKHMDRSPWHAWVASQEQREPTDAMVLGELLHAMVLEGPAGLSRFAVSMTRKTVKAATRAIGASNPGKTCVPQETFEKASRLLACVQQCPEAMELLGGDGWNEESYLWSDPLTGLACKARVDRVAYRTGEDGRKRLRVPDIKTTSGGCGERQFAKTVQDYGYDIQAAHHLAGIEAFWGVRPPWYWVVVETDTGAVAVHRADPELIDWADGRRQRMLATLADCIKTGRWAMPPGGVITRPRWAKE